MKADRRAQSARPREMSLADSLREAKGGACPPFLRSYNKFLITVSGSVSPIFSGAFGAKEKPVAGAFDFGFVAAAFGAEERFKGPGNGRPEKLAAFLGLSDFHENIPF